MTAVWILLGVLIVLVLAAALLVTAGWTPTVGIGS